MQKNKNILFVNPGQFGYMAGYYYYCKYLRDEFNIKFICFDSGFPKLKLDNVEVKYISFHGNKIKRYIKWLKAVYSEIKVTGNRETIVFMVYFKLCFLFGLYFHPKNIVLDLRTGSIKKRAFINYLQNTQFKFETKFFINITILSKKLIDRIGINRSKCHWLPLGAEQLSMKEKSFNDLRMLYVGTLKNRNIHETIEGLKLFINKYSEDNLHISYDIFGFGSDQEEALLNDVIMKNNLGNIVKFHGRKNHSELKEYFDNCNIGVSYVPITYYYEFQPTTKAFEYISSGMVCIATDTYENRQLICSENGVLCGDNPLSFSESLNILYKGNNKFKSDIIRKSLKEYSWQNIVKNNLSLYLNKLLYD